MSEATCRRNFMEIWSACKCVILPLSKLAKMFDLYINKWLCLVSKGPSAHVSATRRCARARFQPQRYDAPGHVFTTQGDSNPGSYADPREGAHARVRHGGQREFVIDIVVVVELRGCDIEPAVDERLRHVEEHRSRLRHVFGYDDEP